MASGEVSFSSYDLASHYDQIKILQVDWVAGASGVVDQHTMTEEEFAPIKGMKAGIGKTVFGRVAPTSNYDIELHDSGEVDIFGGELHNRSNTASGEYAIPAVGSGYGKVPVECPLTFSLSGNIVESGEGQLKVFFYR